jgi:hypothetical protein
MPFKQIDHRTGRGKILLGEEVKREANYDLAVYQERTDTSHLQGQSSIPGSKTVIGKVAVASPDFTPSFDGEHRFTLVLSDGDKIDFFFRDSAGNVMTTGGFYR